MIFKWEEDHIEDYNADVGTCVRGLTRNGIRPLSVSFELWEVLWLNSQLTPEARLGYLHTIQSALRK